MSIRDRIPAFLFIVLLAVAMLAIADGVADPVEPDAVTCPRVATAPRARNDRAVQLQGSVPQAFSTGQRVTLCGRQLFNTYQANPPSAMPAARLLRIGDWYLPIDAVTVSDGGERLSFKVAPGGPYRRLLDPAQPTAPQRYAFVAEPVAGGVITGPVALHSLSSPPDAWRQHSTDVVALTPSVWRAPTNQRRETP
jgi:hypothetical protein